MSKTQVQWLTYPFTVYEAAATTWHDVAGLYIFAKLNSQGAWEALYIGQTSSFATRLPGHERWDEAALLGATHVHARAEKLAATRERIEDELIDYYEPPLNDQ